MVPKVFYWVDVWRLTRQLHHFNMLRVEPLLLGPGSMFRVIVMLEDLTTTHLQWSDVEKLPSALFTKIAPQLHAWLWE